MQTLNVYMKLLLSQMSKDLDQENLFNKREIKNKKDSNAQLNNVTYYSVI